MAETLELDAPATTTTLPDNIFGDLPDAKPSGGSFDDLPDEKPSIPSAGLFDDLPDDPRFTQRLSAAREKITEGEAGAAAAMRRDRLLSFAQYPAAFADFFGTLNRTGGVLAGFARDVMAGEVLPKVGRLVPEELPATSAAIRGEPPPEQGLTAVQLGLSEAVGSTPAVGAAMAATAAGVPAPLAFSTVMGGVTFQQTQDPLQAAESAAIGALIPGVASEARRMAANVVAQAVQRGIVPAENTVLQKAVEAVASQAGVQGFIEASAVPDYASMTAEQRSEALQRSLAGNLAFGLMELPAFKKSIPSETQRVLREDALARSVERAEQAKAPATAQALRQTTVERETIRPPERAEPRAEPPPEVAPKPIEPQPQAVEPLETQTKPEPPKVTQPEIVATEAQAHVSDTVKTEGKRPAKEIKSELISRIEEEIQKAPARADAATPEKVTIEIPDDGTFTVWRTKENLGELLRRAKRLAVTSTAPRPSMSATGPTRLEKGKGKAADRLAALGRFVSTDEARPELQGAWSDGTRVIASDGRMLLALDESLGGTKDKPVMIDPATGKPTAADVTRPKFDEVLPRPEQIESRGAVKVEDLHTAARQAMALWRGETAAPTVELFVREGVLGIRGKSAAGDTVEFGDTSGTPLGTYRADQLFDMAQAASRLGAKTVDIGITRGTSPDGMLVLKGEKWTALNTPLRAAEAPKAEGPAEQRIRGRAERQNVFEMEDGDLADLFNERFGEQRAGGAPLEAGRAGTFTFPSYEAFAKWMGERYAERDLEGMKLAFAEADTAAKIRFIKGHRAAAPHLKDWIAHLATGAPLPADSPPVARTTPRPLPGGGTQPPATPAGPPPAPRQPSFWRKFDVMALTQLFRQFERFPVVNERLMRAYGRFVPGTTAVELKQRLLWDTALAERVLGHELGHFIDIIIPLIGKGKQFANRLRPLTDFRGQMWRSAELRNDARALSREWRGPFANGDRYRDTAVELFADFMSAMFNAPELVNERYPRLHDAFQELRDAKPSFRNAYREIETWLQGDTMADEWIGQQRDAAKRTVDALLTDKPEGRRSFRDILKGSFLSIWHRAFEKERRPREMGRSITDELEYSHTWAAKENALFADDFTKRVQPELEKVNPDPLEARSLLHAYSQARRTIGERRAAGVWIEQHPVQARTMLNALLDLDAALRSKFKSAVDSATNSELYDVAATVFREMHDRGEAYVRRMARQIDGLNLGVDGEAALTAFNVRGKLLNPGGLTPDNAQKVLDKLRDTLTPEQWTALEQAGSNLRDLLHRTQEAAYREGLISKKTWQELIQPNKDNYVPYSVLDYFDGKVRAGVMPQKGTAKDIADVTLAAQLKIAALNAWRQKQRQVKLLMDTYAAGGQPVAVGERLRRSSEIDRIRKSAGDDDVSRAVYWRDGQPHLVEFPGDRGKTLEKAMESPAFYEHFEWINNLGRYTHSIMQMYTTFSIPFLFWRNPVRGARTGALRVGFRAVGKQYVDPREVTQGLRMARNYANAAFGAEMLPEVRELVDAQMLLPPRLSTAMVRDAANLRELLESGGVLATQLRQLREANWPWWKGGDFGKGAYEFAEKLFTSYEAFEKIVNYRAALSRGASQEQAVAIGRRAGIPKPGVGGHLSLAMEVFFPWTRVHLQGARSTLDVLRDPTYRTGFVARFMATEGLPRVLKIGIGTGVAAGAIKWLVRSDEDADDTVMQEVFKRVSPYKMALDDIVPLMLYDPRTGKYHYFNDFKKGSDIPDHYEVVSFRIPASEEGRLWGVLLYNVLSTMPGAKEKMAKPGENLITGIGQWAQNYLAPGISPAIETTDALYEMIARGRNPDDPYRGQPAANQLLFDAGGTDRAQAIAGYVMNQAGGPGEMAAVMAMNFGILDERAADALKKRLATDKTPLVERVPLGRSMFAYDNYARFRDQKSADLAEERLRSKARLVMSDDVRSLYDFYYRNLKHKDDLKGADVKRFELASIFVHDVWGKLNDSESFYSKAAHAVGPDGSSGAKETVKRDLDAASARLLLGFAE